MLVWLLIQPGGVLERGGHTEAAVDLAKLAGLSPVGVLCEITTEDGKHMARCVVRTHVIFWSVRLRSTRLRRSAAMFESSILSRILRSTLAPADLILAAYKTVKVKSLGCSPTLDRNRVPVRLSMSRLKYLKCLLFRDWRADCLSNLQGVVPSFSDRVSTSERTRKLHPLLSSTDVMQ